MRLLVGRWLRPLVVVGAIGSAARSATAQGAANETCPRPLPATIKVARDRIVFPVPSHAESLAITIDPGSRVVGWGRLVGDRSQEAEIKIDAKLMEGKAYTLRGQIIRPLSQEELQFVESQVARLLAAEAGPAARADSLVLQARQLSAIPGGPLGQVHSPGCLGVLPRVSIASSGWADARDSLVARRDAANRAAAELGRVVAALSNWRALRTLYSQVAVENGASPRELVQLGEIATVTVADTTPARLAGFAKRAGAVRDIVNGWKARPFKKVAVDTINLKNVSDSLSIAIARAEEYTAAARRLEAARASYPAAGRTDAARLKQDLAARTVADSFAGPVTVPVAKTTAWNVSAGLHFFGTVGPRFLGVDTRLDPAAPSATRIDPQLTLHYGKGVTWDLGVALGGLGRRGQARDLFWRLNLMTGVGVTVSDLRIGSGVQIYQDRSTSGRSRPGVGYYLALSYRFFGF